MINFQSEFKIKNSNFEGPFEVLLKMIDKKKIFINEINLSKITDEFILFVKENENTLKDISYFISTASTLLLLKSKNLLPKMSLSDEEEQEVKNLSEKLLLYKKFVEISEKIKEKYGKKILPLKKKNFKRKIVFSPHESINKENISASIENLFFVSPIFIPKPEKKVEKIISLKDVIEKISSRIKVLTKMSLSEIFSGQDKKNKAVSFLACLELFREGKIDMSQSESFCDIIIENKDEKKN